MYIIGFKKTIETFYDLSHKKINKLQLTFIFFVVELTCIWAVSDAWVDLKIFSLKISEDFTILLFFNIDNWKHRGNLKGDNC